MTQDLRDLERDVEQARERLLANLSRLSSPMTFAAFKEDVREEARSTFRGVVEDAKGRVAANPAAALAIGAGVAWRLLRDPPISTALIGAGLFSLWRTTPMRSNNGDYLATAQERLGEQVGSFAASVGERAVEAAGALKNNVGDMAEAAKERIKETSEDLADRAESASHRAASAVEDAMRTMPATVSSAMADQETRNTLLLGAAGLAVAAALGIAYQRRSAEERA